MARGMCNCGAYSVPHLIGRGNCARGRCARCQSSLDQCVCTAPAAQRHKTTLRSVLDDAIDSRAKVAK